MIYSESVSHNESYLKCVLYLCVQIQSYDSKKELDANYGNGFIAVSKHLLQLQLLTVLIKGQLNGPDYNNSLLIALRIPECICLTPLTCLVSFPLCPILNSHSHPPERHPLQIENLCFLFELVIFITKKNTNRFLEYILMQMFVTHLFTFIYFVNILGKMILNCLDQIWNNNNSLKTLNH